MAGPDKVFKKIMKPILVIYNNIVCGIRIISNFHKCAIYYLLDIIGYLFYLPFMLLFWITGAHAIERKIWRNINKYGLLIFGTYTNSIMNQCYRCKDKKAGRGNEWFDRMMADMDKDTNKPLSFVEVLITILFFSFILYYMYYYLNIKK